MSERAGNHAFPNSLHREIFVVPANVIFRAATTEACKRANYSVDEIELGRSIDLLAIHGLRVRRIRAFPRSAGRTRWREIEIVRLRGSGVGVTLR